MDERTSDVPGPSAEPDDAETEDRGEREATPPSDDAGDPTVHAENLVVTYRVYTDQRPAMKDIVTGKSRTRSFREIHAVRGVTFTARTGEAIGLIGRNGSGKSTLLRGLAGLLPATSGAAYAASEPVLLGVGSALQQNLSGRRNIELGMLALGMSRDEVQERIDHVAWFADLEDFIDLPLRTYSSGMTARLRFSIATELKPEILMIDEALAVGDALFKKRSESRIQELIESAGTVFLVSHSMSSILDVCNRVMWLEEGQVQADGDPEEVIDTYRRFTDSRSS